LVKELSAFWAHRIRDDTHKEFQLCVAKCRNICSTAWLSDQQQLDAIMYAPVIAYLNSWDSQQNISRVWTGAYLRTGLSSSVEKIRDFFLFNEFATILTLWLAIVLVVFPTFFLVCMYYHDVYVFEPSRSNACSYGLYYAGPWFKYFCDNHNYYIPRYWSFSSDWWLISDPTVSWIEAFRGLF